jgi:hypothetical protein
MLLGWGKDPAYALQHRKAEEACYPSIPESKGLLQEITNSKT